MDGPEETMGSRNTGRRPDIMRITGGGDTSPLLPLRGFKDWRRRMKRGIMRKQRGEEDTVGDASRDELHSYTKGPEIGEDTAVDGRLGIIIVGKNRQIGTIEM